jgi:hypothetical protein
MKVKDFCKKLEKEVQEHAKVTSPDNAHHLSKMKISTLEEAWGVIVAILEVNIRMHEESTEIKKQLNDIMSENDLEEEDLDS